MATFIAVYSGEPVRPMGFLFTKTSPVKQYSYLNDFSGVFDALHHSFLATFVEVFTFRPGSDNCSVCLIAIICSGSLILTKQISRTFIKERFLIF